MANSSAGRGEKRFRATVISPNDKEQLFDVGESYIAALQEVLRSRDVLRFRNFLSSGQQTLPDEMLADTLKLETMLHQIILSLPELSDLHVESQKWLDENSLLGGSILS
ncbi:MAG: hypothetical protein WCS37_19360 [Chloroflexota bacterium]